MTCLSDYESRLEGFAGDIASDMRAIVGELQEGLSQIINPCVV